MCTGGAGSGIETRPFWSDLIHSSSPLPFYSIYLTPGFTSSETGCRCPAAGIIRRCSSRTKGVHAPQSVGLSPSVLSLSFCLRFFVSLTSVFTSTVSVSGSWLKTPPIPMSKAGLPAPSSRQRLFLAERWRYTARCTLRYTHISWSLSTVHLAFLPGAFDRSMQHHLKDLLFKDGVYDPEETVRGSLPRRKRRYGNGGRPGSRCMRSVAPLTSRIPPFTSFYYPAEGLLRQLAGGLV